MSEQSERINEYLAKAAANEVEAGAVVPKGETCRRLEKEIAAKGGCQPITFGVDENLSSAKNLAKSFISAHPAQFPEEALDLIDHTVAGLKQAGATRFELLLRNTNHSERITVGVRFI